jgi:hypothetical protein
MVALRPAGRLLLVMFPCALTRRVAGQYVALSCDTQEKLQANLDFVRTTCRQAGETFTTDRFNPLPLTCHHPACARVVERAARDCDTILRSGWFAPWGGQLTAAVAKCALVPQLASTYAIGKVSTLRQCGVALAEPQTHSSLQKW